MARPEVHPPKLDDALVARLRSELLAWYAGAARDLPWRRTRDPFAIWLSEVMLQQTRVEAVVGYWQRFLDALPTIEALAAADEDQVLALWSGLGYYRRARALQAAAQRVVALHGGRLPADPAALADLPGFGPYTTGAVASIAFGLAEPLVDGNVARVFARWFELELEPHGGPWRRTNWGLARALLVADQPGAWNQALMELGATVCTPRSPRCGACPVASDCRARAAGRTAELPLPPKKRAVVEVHVEALLAESPAGVLLVRRPPGGRNPGLFELPTRELAAPGRPPAGLWPGDFGTPKLEPHWEAADEASPFRHAITHHRIRVEARRVGLKPAVARRLAASSAYDLVPRERLESLPLSGLTAKIIAAF
ncbi:MAG: A/G-specific adenine glycosylase [Planctomycetota bacterium]|nr:A/G-specific adenine glycosylase [Planctomycetota bacterium]